MVVLSVNVSVFEYEPVRSGSVRLMSCLNVMSTLSLETGAVHADFENETRSGSARENAPLVRYAGDGVTDRAASPAVEMTFAVVVAV